MLKTIQIQEATAIINNLHAESIDYALKMKTYALLKYCAVT